MSAKRLHEPNHSRSAVGTGSMVLIEERRPRRSRTHFSFSPRWCGDVGHEPGRELPPLVTVRDVAEFASLLGNPARAGMMMALLEHENCTASELADAAGVTAQTASGHIAKLLEAGILARVKIGREQHHRIGSPDMQTVIRLLYMGGAKLTKRSARKPQVDLGTARSCSGHVSGKLGVALANQLTVLGLDGMRRLHGTARNQLLTWGLPTSLAEFEGAECTICDDWSEHGHHIAGALGRAIRQRCVALGWLKPAATNRVMTLTSAGLNGIRARFGLDLA